MNILDATEQFMKAAGQLNDPSSFGSSEDALRMLRRTLMDEEVEEYYEKGEFQNDPVETLDGLLDIIVIAWGTALAYFGPEKAKAAAAEVVRSNMSKIDGTLGPMIKREDGKVLKPEGWTPPDIAGVLADIPDPEDYVEPNFWDDRTTPLADG